GTEAAPARGSAGQGRAADLESILAMYDQADAGRGKPRPYTSWPGMPGAGSGDNRSPELFEALRELVSGRRALLGKLGGSGGRSNPLAPVASADELQTALGTLQGRTPAHVVVDGKPRPRSIQHVKQDVLAQLRQKVPGPTPPTLDEKDADTIDLVDMLFDHIMKDVKPNSPAATLLAQLQVPLLRLALQDKGFFTRRQHPARQMLNAIAETGAYWMGD